MKALLLRFSIALLLFASIGALGVQAFCSGGHCAAQSRGPTQTPTTTPSTGSGFAIAAISIVGSISATTPRESPSAGTITGLAIIGDSTQDEYQADNPRGGNYSATTFNWVELLARERSVNLGSWGNRPEPRRSGFEFNWARSGATSGAMIYAGQHTGAAEQIRAGVVTHVIIQIGINDFYYDDVALAIYRGEIAGSALQARIEQLVTNAEVAVRTLKEAGGAQIIVASTQDYVSHELLPEVRMLTPDPAGRQRLVATFASINAGLRDVATREQVPFFDFNAALQRELDTRYATSARTGIRVGGETIDLSTRGDEPHHAFIGDGYAHPGTVLAGLYANLYIEEMNATFGTTLVPLSDEEILRIAGIPA